jgi:hypothetical protein
MEWLKVLKDYVPLFQTMIWVLLIVFGLGLFRRELNKLLESVYKRIGGSTGGGSIEASVGIFSLKIGEDLRDLKYAQPTNATATLPAKIEENKLTQPWKKTRSEIYSRNRDVFLVHVLEPSKKPEQKFDIFMYLINHKGSNSTVDIDYVMFFLGKGWGNRVFKVQNEGGPIGLSTSAFGSFLAICHVVFKDGHEVTLDRYIDFEMGKQVVSP